MLLALQLFGVLLYPFMDESAIGRAALSSFAPWSSVLHAVFYFYTSFALLRFMVLDRFVTTDEPWATGATFTVVAWAFAYTFMAVQFMWPGSFTAAIATRCPADVVRDALPVVHEPDERSWVMIEQVAGLMYVALVVSRIVGLTIARQRA